MADRLSRFNRGRNNVGVGNDTEKHSLNVDDLDDWMLDLDDILADLEKEINNPKKRKEYVKHLTRAAHGDEFKVVDNKEQFNALVEMLMDKKTLTYKDIKELFPARDYAL